MSTPKAKMEPKRTTVKSLVSVVSIGRAKQMEQGGRKMQGSNEVHDTPPPSVQINTPNYGEPLAESKSEGKTNQTNKQAQCKAFWTLSTPFSK